MHFINKKTALALAILVAVSWADNTINFINLDGIARMVVWMPNPGFPNIAISDLPPNHNATVTVPENWAGMFKAVHAYESPNPPAVIGEVTFNAGDVTYYDVSGIDPNNVNEADNDGIHWMAAIGDSSAVPSGCSAFPCDTSYIHPDDVQTQSTHATQFNCWVGNGYITPS